jgi:hydroxymethylbilane synthase
MRIGTRGSALALAQAALVAEALDHARVAHEVVVIETAGDRRAPDTAWGEGAFVTAIERALADGRVDIAVHSAKDIPTDEDPRLQIAAYLTRAEPRDALVLPVGVDGSLDTLPSGTIVGTDSPRRTGFLRAHRADLDVRPLHGNVDTRLRRLDEGAVDALVLAAAGLMRLGRADRIRELLAHDVVPPAPGQGAIAVQIRRGDERTAALVARIDDMPTRRAVEAERAFLRATGGGCRAPIGALAKVGADAIELSGGFASVDGRASGLEQVAGPIGAGLELAEELAARLAALRAQLSGPRVLVTRPAADARPLTGRLAELGIAAIVVPAIDVVLLDDPPGLAAALNAIDGFDRVIATSANGARAIGRAAAARGINVGTVRWAAVGRATARELMGYGANDVWIPTDANAATLAREMPAQRGDVALWVHGDLADTTLVDELRERGVTVTTVVAYGTVVGPADSRALLEQSLESDDFAAVILASPSAVHGLLELVVPTRRSQLLAIPAVTVGSRTSTAARAAGFSILGEIARQEASALAELTAELVARHRPEDVTHKVQA